MLRRMVMMVASSATCGVRFCNERPATMAFSKVLKSWKKIPFAYRDMSYLGNLGTPLIKLRPRTRRKERCAQLSGEQMHNPFSGYGHSSFCQNRHYRLKRAGGTVSCTSSTARLPSGDMLDAISEANQIATKSPHDKNGVGRPSIVLSDEALVKAIVYEARRGCVNTMGKTKRFSDFLLEQVKAVGERYSLDGSIDVYKAVRGLLSDIELYPQMERRDRVTLLSKIAKCLGYESLQDVVAYDNAIVEASAGLQHQTSVEDSQSMGSSSQSRSSFNGGHWSVAQQNFDMKEPFRPRAILRQVPGIKYGSSDPIILPDHRVKRNSPLVPIGDEGMSQNQTVQESSSVDHEALGTSVTHQGTDLEVGGDFEGPEGLKSAQEGGPESSQSQTADDSAVKHVEIEGSAEEGGSSALTETLTVQKDETFIFATASDAELLRPSKVFMINEKWGLDMSISSVKPLSAALRARLEENGFSTVRLLLHHFPRMYQNFHPPGQRVEDGQNLSFVGTVVQSRGVPRGFSLGLVEIIVRSEVDDVNSDNPDVNSGDGAVVKHNDRQRTEKPVFLHLKRFFKGSRYSNLGFLNAMARKYPEDSQVTVCGKVKAMTQRDHFEIREFNIELWDGIYRDDSGPVESADLAGGKPYPVYPVRGSLQQSTIEFCIQRLLPLLSDQLDPMPKAFREQFQIQDLHEAYRGIHAPNQSRDAEVARHRLVFDEFFYLQLGMLLLRQELAGKCDPDLDLASVLHGGFVDIGSWSPLTLRLLESLPYNLTKSQTKAVGEVIWDLRRPLPMSRLLQGDVGCGKTIVALLALLEVVGSGCQGALMAPTEFLAMQHYERIASWFENLEESERPRIALLTGSTTLSKARAIRRGLEAGEIALAIGTHSLISDSVKFSALKLAVIDEQHRFGVSQRGRLNNKGREAAKALDLESGGGDSDISESILRGAPHILAMSATPIPRTLALAMHGDMSLSQITELPPGRAETITIAIHGDTRGRQEAYEQVRAELEQGGRVFVVFPVIGESEELPDVRAAETEFKNLELEFKDFNVGLVHGRMRPNEKDEAMEKFKSGDTQVLVSTTVIEVGIDIPEASMIVVEHAERYGMAQLHQLRGRVGRSSRASSCILLGSRKSSLTRLKLLEQSRDGFFLAQIDLEQRGPGDLLGKRQSGYLPEFNIAQLERDGDVLEQARQAAEEMLLRYPLLKDLPRIRHELNMRRLPISLS